MCTKLILNHNRYSSTREAVRELHWIPVRLRITFKLLCLVHKCKYGISLQYLKDLLVSPPQPKHNLRSSTDITRLIIPFTKWKTFAARSFSVAGPTEWNLLPSNIRETESYELFKKKLKTHFFIQYFDS